MKNKFKYTLFLIAQIAFFGCAIGPDFERPAVELTAEYREKRAQEGVVESSASIANLNWWEIYSDPVLQSIVKEALENNKDLGIASARVEQALAVLGGTQADLYPQIGVSGQAGRSQASKQALAFRTTPINNFGLLSNLNFEIDIWGKLRRATEAERANLLATEYAYRGVTVSLVAGVATTYFNILGSEQRYNISKNTYENRKGATKLIKDRYDKGLITELDVNQAQIEEAKAAVAMALVERNLQQLHNALNVLLGRSNYDFKVGMDLNQQPVPTTLPVGFPAELLERRPDVRAAEELAHAQVARVGVAKGQQLPALNLAGFIGYQSLESNTLLGAQARTWNIGGNIAGPLLDFGKSSASIESAEAQAKAALLNYELSVLKAVQEVEDSLVTMRTAKDAYFSREMQLTAAKNAARIARVRYDEGLSTYLEVLDIERSLFEAELGASNERETFLVSIIQLYKSLGGGWNNGSEAA